MPILLVEGLFVLLWSSGFIVVEFALLDAGPFTILAWRYAATALLLGGCAMLAGDFARMAGRDIRRAAVTGLLAHLLWLGAIYTAQDLGVPPGHTALVAALQPLATAALSGVVVGERASRRAWLGLMLGFAGVFVAVGPDAGARAPLGAYALAFLPVATLTAAVLLERRQAVSETVSTRPAPVLGTLAVQLAVTAVGALPAALLLEGLHTRWSPSFLVALAWLGPVLSFGSYALLWHLVRVTDATRASALFYFTPPATMVMAWLLFGHEPGWHGLLGLVCAAVGVALVRMPKRPEPSPPIAASCEPGAG